MWWPWWLWGACVLHMGCVCAVRELRVACGSHGGHGVRVDYLWAMYMGCVCAVREVQAACGGHGVHVDYLWLCVCCEGNASCMWWPWVHGDYLWAVYVV